MAKIKPFEGIRYAAADISKLICPPYDVISPQEKESLKKRSADNMVRLELPDAKGSKNKYSESSKLFNSWLSRGVLVQDCVPSLYFYEQKFTDHGKRMTRRGFFVDLRLENPHGGAVKPHEKTLKKPKEDRLKLLRAVKANLSPVFGLFNDSQGKMVKLLKEISKRAPVSKAKDNDNVEHRLWKVDDFSTLKKVVNFLSVKNIFIADGHHRYETAWNFSQESRLKDKYYHTENEYNYILVYLCPMQDEGLSVWPTHRVFKAPGDIMKKIRENFKVLPETSFKKLEGKLPQPIALRVNGKIMTLMVKDNKILKKSMPGKCTAFRELGVSILHNVLLSGMKADEFIYVKNDKEALSLAKKKGLACALVPATPIEAIESIASAAQTMPQKSTYFYPKVASGLVIHSLK